MTWDYLVCQLTCYEPHPGTLAVRPLGVTQTGRELLERQSMTLTLEDLGMKGWELSGVDNGRFYFKRQAY